MFSKLFGRKREEQAKFELPRNEHADWSFVGVDVHSHFLPGIDDGAKTVEDSLVLIKAMIGMGYKKIITTPHVMVDYYPNTTATITEALNKVKDALHANNIDITLHAAAEYYIDDYFIKLIDTEPLLTIHGNQVLVEFSMMYEPPMLFDVLAKLQAAGYLPIIAHPERYLFFHKDFHRYHEFRDRGCLMQLNMLSIAGYYGKNIKIIAEELLAKGLYDYTGSDMHHERHAAALKGMAGTRDYDKFVGYPFRNSSLLNT